jgi:flavin-binding protein dodecin
VRFGRREASGRAPVRRIRRTTYLRRPKRRRYVVLRAYRVVVYRCTARWRAAARDRILRARVDPGEHRARTEEDDVNDHVYRLSEVVGSSPTSVDEAIRTAIRKASQTVRNIEWFQAEEVRGQVVDGDVAYFQVRLKIGFRVD